MKTYKLKNLDCHECAADIEKSLNKRKDVRSVSINFATSTMTLDSPSPEEVLRDLADIHPDITVIGEHIDDGHRIPFRSLVPIGIAAVLFITGLFFQQILHATPYSFAEYLVFGCAYIISGWKVLRNAAINMVRGKLFDENFLMSVATIGAFLINELPEAVGVMLFYQVGEFFQNLSLSHSRRSIGSLLALRPETAHLKTETGLKTIHPKEVAAGSTIVVKPGERVPLDGVIVNGTSQVDTSPLTGESVPRILKKGDTILAGMINKTAAVSVTVKRVFSESSLSVILDLVENANRKKAGTEKFISRFARFYTPFVVATALLIALLPPLLFQGFSFQDAINRALVLLVISCPCALVLSIPLGYFSGIGKASKNGILIKGSNYLDILTGIKTVIFDKTGTLTKGVFTVREIVPEPGYTKEEVLRLAVSAESHSNHPIAASLFDYYGKKPSSHEITSHEEVSGHGVIATVSGKRITAGNDGLLHREGISHTVCHTAGTVVHVAEDDRYAGYIIIGDEIKDDAREAIDGLRKEGIKRIVLFTGDSEDEARILSSRLSLDEYHAHLLPEEKVRELEKVLDGCGKGEQVAFVGDGINDAPVIARADVGFAMGKSGTDAAIDTADIVLMTDRLSKIGEAVRIGKKTRRIIIQNIVFAITVKIAFIILGSLGYAEMWFAVFADIGVSLLAVFNAMRILR
ncbi:MAG: cadmium-translocating P-type ATPase [Spirochaetales bacterium]|nr:cadmium-translocating P-type ATPase [Spirochaetales bacterium]